MKSSWLVGIVVLVALALIFGISVLPTPESGTFFYNITEGFRGNLVSGVVVTAVFLICGIYFDSLTERKIDSIRAFTKTVEEADEIKRRIEGFDRVMRKEPYYDIFLPDLKTEHHQMGLFYAIEPQRDPVSKEPIRKYRESDEYYVIRVRGPSHEAMLDEDKLLDYENSPIRDGEFYFCRFLNSSWYMSESESLGGHRFSLLGKVGQCFTSETANAFMRCGTVPAGYTKVSEFVAILDGTEWRGSGSGYKWELYRDQNGNPWLRTHDSPMKQVYRTNEENTYGNAEFFTVIEGVRGYYGGEARTNFTTVIEEKCREAGIAIPEVQWYNLG